LLYAKLLGQHVNKEVVVVVVVVAVAVAVAVAAAAAAAARMILKDSNSIKRKRPVIE
jgi:ATP-dependent protease ClpP protease subunit